MRLRDGVFIAPLLAREKWLRHAFGTRRTKADLRLPAATLKQLHSDIVQIVKEPEERLPGDALMTGTPGLALTVKTADCLPVFLADPEHHAVAAVHAGWRGTLRRIAEKALGMMRRSFGTRPQKVLAALGPSIRACCYEVGQEVIEQYRSQFPYADELFRSLDEENPADIMVPRQVMVEQKAFMRPLTTARAYLDLEEANCRQLLEAGVSPQSIARGAPCTACRTDLLYSHRKEGAGTGRLLSQIAVVRL